MTAIVRREVFDRLGRFDERLRRAEDYEFWLRLAHGGYRLAHVPERLAIHREHSTSLSANWGSMVDAQITMYTLVADTYDLDPEARARVNERANDWRRYKAAMHDPTIRTTKDRVLARARSVKRIATEPRRWLRTMPENVATTLAKTSAHQISSAPHPARRAS
jgi:hypothetical protein